MTATVAQYTPHIEALARKLGLDYHPVDFELVPTTFMMEVAVYGLPVRMPHWSFGVRYIHQLIQHGMGNSRIFEVMFPGDPCHAYLVGSNTVAENSLVTAHVLGHADFARNNHLFVRFERMAGTHILEHSAAQAHRIEAAVTEFGAAHVEAVLDAALALEAHIDTNLELHRPLYPQRAEAAEAADTEDSFRKRFKDLPGEAVPAVSIPPRLAPVPPNPEYDLLWFIAHYAPELQDWERDVFLAVREESFYFYPVFACQIMNEGWATYWHARLLAEADFLPENLYLDAIKAHSDVVRPYAAEQQAALAVNPYHLGFSMWSDIVDKHGIDKARQICREEDDFGFVRNYLDRELAERLGLFVFEAEEGGGIKVSTNDIDRVREAILAPRFNFGAPRIHVSELRHDGSLVLRHDHESDGRGLDLRRAATVLEYMNRIWRRPVFLHTVDASGSSHELVAK
ncbi:MAG TPA: SpoVR family protein [Burkholderiales bacterium]|nr:SpoVR family protein [Burkholderiales bacterium]